jgi:hypothetical protein
MSACGTFSVMPAAPTNVRFAGVKQPCRRNLETAEFDRLLTLENAVNGPRRTSVRIK